MAALSAQPKSEISSNFVSAPWRLNIMEPRIMYSYQPLSHHVDLAELTPSRISFTWHSLAARSVVRFRYLRPVPLAIIFVRITVNVA